LVDFRHMVVRSSTALAPRFHLSRPMEARTLIITASSSVSLAVRGMNMRSKIKAIGVGGESRTNVLKRVRVMIENISNPLVQICWRYGGPMLNTAATRIYWKDETKKSTVFS